MKKEDAQRLKRPAAKNPEVDGGTEKTEDSENVKAKELNAEKILEKLNELKRLRALAKPKKAEK